ncbi:MAG: acyl-CoA dehydrogenase, partial [Proteobacteria bacterium]|nr:acyl-CoA dehydrogenase [Pseudomonadota bacterium]
GTSNAMLNFGESGECHGTLIGELHQGLACMFHMMNEVRVGVGLGAAILGYAGYLYSLEYAKTRLQGRHPQDKDPATPQIALIEHMDVKRLLLQQKSYVEGSMALVLYCARLIDERTLIEDEERREELDLLMDILTPIAKSWPSEFCLEANKQAIQILGGYGYTRDYPVERLYRDNRLNLIHEGAHAIHGIDILGRKVRMKNGRAFKILVAEIERTIRYGKSVPVTKAFAEALQASLRTSEEVTKVLVTHPDLNRSMANATLYLDALGTLVVAWMWLKQALVAASAMASADGSERDFYEGKLRACKFFFVYELPLAVSNFGIVASLDDTALTMPPEAYASA